MKYGKLVTVVTTNTDYVFAGAIRDADACELAISRGKRVADTYASDPFTVKVHLEKDFRGVQLPSLIGNSRALLMLHQRAVELFEQHLDLGEHEVFPFSLINHKGRVHS